MAQSVTPNTSTGPERLVAGRYRLTDRLGRGGMADVWAAVDTRLGRPVAVKVLRAEMAARPDIRRRFGAEARAAAGLSHPHAVSVFDTGEFAGRPYLVMERLTGGTLGERIASGPVDPAWLRQVLIDVLGALGKAHAAGIVHRDVKPANILLTASGQAKIADFGIAKSIRGDAEEGTPADLTSAGQLMGTPAYLAPELLDGRTATASADLYGLGVVAYEALTGHKPFVGEGPLAVVLAVAQGLHLPLGEARPDLDPALVAVVERAMSADPDDRFASAAAMQAALSSASPTTVGAAGAGARGAAVQTSPSPTVAGAAGVAALAAALAEPAAAAAAAAAATIVPDPTTEMAAGGIAEEVVDGVARTAGSAADADAGAGTGAGARTGAEVDPDGIVDAVSVPSGVRTRRRLRNWIAVGAMAAAGAALIASGVAATRESGGRVGTGTSESPSSTTPRPSTTVAPATTAPTTTTTIAPFTLEGLLKDLADSLDRQLDGRRAGALSTRLDRVAKTLGDEDQGDAASEALQEVADWLAGGEISASAANSATQLLILVPGARPTGAR